MTDSSANAAQIEFWNSPAGDKWVTHDDAMGAFLSVIKQRLLERTAARPGERVLDVGCGTGRTTLDLAAQTGPDGRVVGVDVSRALLDRAKGRLARSGLANVELILADAQTFDFPAGEFDLMTSRFGVMFFDDPVAAFRNIAAALKPGGRMAFVAWSTLDNNPWFTLPRDAAIARLGKPAPVPANAPGPFAFQDTATVLQILADAGLADPTVSVEEISLTPAGDLAEVARLASTLGPAARIIKEKDGGPDDIAAIMDKIAEGLAGYAAADGSYAIPAQVNFFDAVRR